MNTIIIYATKHGTVEKAVNMLKSKMDGEIEVYNIGKEKPALLEKFDIVLIGGSIYMGKVQTELIDYMNGNLDTLLSKRVGLFLCAGHPDPKQLELELQEAFPEVLYNHAFVKEIFGHEFDLKKLNLFEKFIIKKIQGIKENQFALSDKKISEFAEAMM